MISESLARLSIPFRNLLRVSARSRTGTTAGNPAGMAPRALAGTMTAVQNGGDVSGQTAPPRRHRPQRTWRTCHAPTLAANRARRRRDDGRAGRPGPHRPRRRRQPGRSRRSGRRRRRGAGSGPVLGGRAHPGRAGLAHVPRHRQRRLHQRAHRRAPGLRRRRQPVPARQPRRADRSGDAVPDQLQPGLRAPVGEPDGGAGHERALGHRRRPLRRLPVRPAHLPRRPARPERPQPAGPPGLAAQPGRRPAPQPPAAGLLTRADLHQPGPAELQERHPVPGQQAGHHATAR